LSELLLDTGIAADISDARHLRIALPFRDVIHVHVVVGSRPPTPSEMRARRASADPGTVTGFVTPRVNAAARRVALEDTRFALFGLDDGVVILGGEERSTRGEEPAHRISPRAPYARFALYRALVRTREPRSQTTLAGECGVSQMSISKLLAADPALAGRTSGGWLAHDPTSLVERFLADYPGPGGLSEFWFSPRPVVEQGEIASTTDVSVLLSGDTAADRLAPWRIPRRARVYCDHSLPLEEAGFGRTDPREASLHVTIPADRTIRATATAWYPDGRTVDPLVAAWDLRSTGGADSSEAVDRLLSTAMTSWTR
jgi:hypothetical protein